jgi:hypothetical protein
VSTCGKRNVRQEELAFIRVIYNIELSPVSLDVAKACDTVWVDGFLYKLTALNFPSYLVKTISSYLNSRTFEASFQTPTSTCRMRAGELRVE